ncbi:UNVERIFIED_CONTAM: hypothetical protein Sangu_1735800 [Sesamum angustifolium]|uniref:Uncharacterized protein n=1 Tax=Sesamum angustifolium TaxID=2727405 RepID=A0AAW2M689_9LAMI
MGRGFRRCSPVSIRPPVRTGQTRMSFSLRMLSSTKPLVTPSAMSDPPLGSSPLLSRIGLYRPLSPSASTIRPIRGPPGRPDTLRPVSEPYLEPPLVPTLRLP